ncbi:MAG: hypothetical protein RLZZ370_613, partial [Bacteroidota bacterium]
MKRLTVWLFAAIVILAACREPMVQSTVHCAAPANDSSAQHPKAAIFNQILKAYTLKGLPGISVLVEDEHGTWTGAAGMADIATQVPFAPCTVNKLGSITKMMFATMVFQLAEQNLIDLDEPISKYLSKDLIGRVNNASEASL